MNVFTVINSYYLNVNKHLIIAFLLLTKAYTHFSVKMCFTIALKIPYTVCAAHHFEFTPG